MVEWPLEVISLHRETTLQMLTYMGRYPSSLSLGINEFLTREVFPDWLGAIRTPNCHLSLSYSLPSQSSPNLELRCFYH